jgi:hypothetical protein
MRRFLLAVGFVAAFVGSALAQASPPTPAEIKEAHDALTAYAENEGETRDQFCQQLNTPEDRVLAFEIAVHREAGGPYRGTIRILENLGRVQQGLGRGLN